MNNILELENKVAQLEVEVERHKAMFEKQKVLYQTCVDALEKLTKEFGIYDESIKSKIENLKSRKELHFLFSPYIPKR
ncbi:MAG: hypothetical protein GX957_05055 [Clostridiaceae bacterium]|nr:hypothetical protein [Clostridiaceae bacterium]